MRFLNLSLFNQLILNQHPDASVHSVDNHRRQRQQNYFVLDNIHRCFKKTVFELWAWKASSWLENSHYPDGWREPCLKGCNATVLIEVGIIVFLPGIIVRTHILIHRNLGWGAYCRFYPLHYADARRETSSMDCWSESSCNYAGLSLVNWTFNRSIPHSNSLSFP